MVAVTKKREIEELVRELKGKVAIFSCNTCTRSVYPPTGGVEAVRQLQSQLEDRGFEVSAIYYLTAACFEDIVSQTPISDNWDTGIVLACESGYAAVKRHTAGNTVRGLETLGIMMEDSKNKYKEIIPLEI